MAFFTIGTDAHLTNNHIVPEWCVSYELHLTLNFRRLSQASFFCITKASWHSIYSLVEWWL